MSAVKINTRPNVPCQGFTKNKLPCRNKTKGENFCFAHKPKKSKSNSTQIEHQQDDEKKYRIILLVTGGTGLVGQAVKELVEEINEKVTEYTLPIKGVYVGSKDADLRDYNASKALFERVKPTHVIHLAAYVGGVYHNITNPVEFIKTNTRIDQNVLQLAQEYKVKKLVACLSTCVFPDVTSYPLEEKNLHLGPPHPSNEGYAITKRLLEVSIRAYRRQFGCNFVSVIPTNIFGPGDNYDINVGHVVPSLIQKAFLAKEQGHEWIIAGSGKPLRQFIYSKDLAKLLLWSLENYTQEEPLILSPDIESEVTIAKVAELIAKSFGIQGPLKFDTSQVDGQYRKTASNAKLRTFYPDFVFTPLETAIAETVSYFISNVPTK